MNERQIHIPGWKIIRVIGEGSFGTVYEVEKEDEFSSGIRSALKVISIPESNSEIAAYRDDGFDDASLTALYKSRVEDITAEFRLMNKLKGCNNVVSYEDHTIVQHENNPGYDIYIRMELLTPLPRFYEQQFGNGPVDEKTVRKLGIDICNALERCSRHSIIHRDIKPQNIFVNEEGDFKLGDFGIAKTSDHTTKATKAGSYGYMAPEVYWGKQYNASVDQYSLGIMMYWMLNERRGPFLPMPPAMPKSSDNTEALERRMHGEPLPEPKHGSEELKRIVLKACAYDPKDRYANPTEMKDDLMNLSFPKEHSVLEKTITVNSAPVVDQKQKNNVQTNSNNLTIGSVPIQHDPIKRNIKPDGHSVAKSSASAPQASGNQSANVVSSAQSGYPVDSKKETGSSGKKKKPWVKPVAIALLAAVLLIALQFIGIPMLVGRTMCPSEPISPEETTAPYHIDSSDVNKDPSNLPVITITFDANGNSFDDPENGTSFQKTITSGEKIYYGDSVAYNHNSRQMVVGWYLDQACTEAVLSNEYAPNYTPKNDITLYAKWAEYYKVIFNANDASNNYFEYTEYFAKGNHMDGIPVPFSTNPSLAFAGWYLDADCSGDEIDVFSYHLTSDMTFFAKWVKGVKVTYDANGEYFEKLDYEETYTEIIAPGQEAYGDVYFAYNDNSKRMVIGWYTDPECTDLVMSPNARFGGDGGFVVSEDITFYAKWSDYCEITFDGNGGYFYYNQSDITWSMVYPKNIGFYDWLTPVLTHPNGLEFDGWYLNAENTGERISLDGYCFSKDTILYAKWKYSFYVVRINQRGHCRKERYCFWLKEVKGRLGTVCYESNQIHNISAFTTGQSPITNS